MGCSLSFLVGPGWHTALHKANSLLGPRNMLGILKGPCAPLMFQELILNSWPSSWWHHYSICSVPSRSLLLGNALRWALCIPDELGSVLNSYNVLRMVIFQVSGSLYGISAMLWECAFIRAPNMFSPLCSVRQLVFPEAARPPSRGRGEMGIATCYNVITPLSY